VGQDWTETVGQDGVGINMEPTEASWTSTAAPQPREPPVTTAVLLAWLFRRDLVRQHRQGSPPARSAGSRRRSAGHRCRYRCLGSQRRSPGACWSTGSCLRLHPLYSARLAALMHPLGAVLGAGHRRVRVAYGLR
jgi:hypothetical protein